MYAREEVRRRRRRRRSEGLEATCAASAEHVSIERHGVLAPDRAVVLVAVARRRRLELGADEHRAGELRARLVRLVNARYAVPASPGRVRHRRHTVACHAHTHTQQLSAVAGGPARRHRAVNTGGRSV